MKETEVVMQKPKMSPFIENMKSNIAADCNVSIDCINIKATTEEKLGFTGDGSGVSAHAVCLIYSE
jgi:2-C-methyl-D-erythritol 2,4-cyclodiphosphate synthase